MSIGSAKRPGRRNHKDFPEYAVMGLLQVHPVELSHEASYTEEVCGEISWEEECFKN
jgi:hypothetical protein